MQLDQRVPSQRRTREALSAVVALWAMVLAAACASASTLPPISSSPSGQVTPGRAVWYELVTTDLERAKRFYGGLFGWTFRDVEIRRGRYTVASRDGERVGGIFQPRDGSVGTSSQWLTYFSVDSVDESAHAGEERGAQVVLRPVDLPGRGRAALLVDPEGAPFALIRPTGGDPPAREPPVNAWLWVELWCHSPEAAGHFYGGLFDLQPRALEIAGTQYGVLERDEHSYAGLIQLLDDVRPNWLPVVRVADAEGVATRAAEMGGRVVLSPSEASPPGSAAIVVDPSGAAVGVQVWPVPVPEVRAARADKP
jgi:predicted enzyme related to lactoylglutathione lyase